jgi:hypothetical protein
MIVVANLQEIPISTRLSGEDFFPLPAQFACEQYTSGQQDCFLASNKAGTLVKAARSGS